MEGDGDSDGDGDGHRDGDEDEQEDGHGDEDGRSGDGTGRTGAETGRDGDAENVRPDRAAAISDKDLGSRGRRSGTYPVYRSRLDEKRWKTSRAE